MEPRDQCQEHKAGGNGLPCPWPGCGIGVAGDTVTFGAVTYKRLLNITDDKPWYTWKLIRTR